MSSGRLRRSKFAVDLFYRLWDETNSNWVVHKGKHIWALKASPERIRELLIEEGRNPETLVVERVFVSVGGESQ